MPARAADRAPAALSDAGRAAVPAIAAGGAAVLADAGPADLKEIFRIIATA